MVELDAINGQLNVLAADFDSREVPVRAPSATVGMGRELFAIFRAQVGSAEDGASIF
jgi:phosphogluconate dehydratase